MRDCVGCAFAGLGGCAGYKDASAICFKEMTAAEKKEFIDGCDGSCLDHPENPNYCKQVCVVRPLWKEARAASSREIDYGLFVHPDDGKSPRWVPRRFQTLPQARAAALEITSSRTGDARKVEIYATGRGCHIDTTCQLVETNLRRIPVHGGNLVRTLVEGLERAMCRDEGCHPRSDYAVIVDSDTFLRLRMESGRAAMGLPIDAQMKLADAEIWVMRKMDGYAVARILERGNVE